MRFPSRISPNEPVPANACQIAEHPDTIPHDADFGGGIMGPAHGDLHASQIMALGKEKDFRIETKAFDALLLKDDAGPRKYECLESTLRVTEMNSRNQLNESVEDLAGELAQSRLMDSD